jgi:hypothetical protein
VCGAAAFVALFRILASAGVDWPVNLAISLMPLLVVVAYVQFFVNGKAPSYASDVLLLLLWRACSVFEYFDLKILSDEFPVYPSPYRISDDNREFPSPGHLAHALKMAPPDFPWRAINSPEAEKYARADVTLDEALSEGIIS